MGTVRSFTDNAKTSCAWVDIESAKSECNEAKRFFLTEPCSTPRVEDEGELELADM